MKAYAPRILPALRAARFASLARAGVAVVLLAALAACGTPPLSEPPAPEPLRTVATDPAPGAGDVPVTVQPSATFDGDVAPGTLAGAFALHRGGTTVPGATAYRPESRTARFVPDAELEPGTAYEVVVADTVTSAAGGGLDEPARWTFTTASAPDGGAGTGDENDGEDPGGDPEGDSGGDAGSDPDGDPEGDPDGDPNGDPDGEQDGDPEGAGSVLSVVVTGGDRTLSVGQEIDLEAVVDATGEVDRTVVWSTADPAVATIDAGGRLTAVAPGTTTATAASAHDPSVTGTIRIDVNDDAASVVTIDPDAVSFPGTSEATVDVRADGSWTARSDAPWLTIDVQSGTGDATLRLTVDRTGLAPGDYGARITVDGGSVVGGAVEAVATVAMRFPTVHGQAAGDATGPAGPTFASSDPNTLGAAGAGADAFGAGVPEDVGVAGVDHVPGEVIVRFDPAHVAAAARGAGRLDLAAAPLRRDEVLATAAAVARRNDLANVRSLADRNAIVLARTHRPLEETIAALQADPRVVSAEPNRYLQFAADPNDPGYADQWHYPLIGLPEAWDVTIGTAEVTVAVIDGGFATGHEDLAAKWTDGYDFANGVPDADATGTACARHGTHVAGTVGASTNDGVGVAGVAPNARLLPIRIGYEDPDAADPACLLRTSALVSALAWIAGDEMPGVPPLPEADVPEVVNLSLGGATRIPSIEPLLERLRDDGIVTVAAAGNGGVDALLYPARYATTIAVGAVGPDGSRARYSSYGDGLDVMAPGGSANGDATDDVLSTLPPTVLAPNGAYGFLAGTSMAAPHVAGVVALLRSLDPSLDLEAARQVLHRSGDRFASGWSPEVGYGLIRAAEAVRLVREERFGTFEATLWQGGTVVATVPVARDGAFAFEQVPVGAFDVEVVGPDEAGGSAVTVGYDGDAFVRVEVQ